jgi:hypothetical protein
MDWEDFSEYSNLCGLTHEQTAQLKRSFLRIERTDELRIILTHGINLLAEKEICRESWIN